MIVWGIAAADRKRSPPRGGGAVDWNDEPEPSQGYLTVRRSPSSAMSSGERTGASAFDSVVDGNSMEPLLSSAPPQAVLLARQESRRADRLRPESLQEIV